MSFQDELKQDDGWIYHVCTREAWAAAESSGTYCDESLEREGFIHFSYGRQVEGVLKRHFAGKSGLILLEIEKFKLEPGKLIDEDLYGLNELYPHYYGGIGTGLIERIILVDGV